MNYKELLSIIVKPWIDTQEIMQIASCGRNSATKIRIDIENEIKSSGKKIPVSSRKHVPTKMVLNYLGLEEEYIRYMASIS